MSDPSVADLFVAAGMHRTNELFTALPIKGALHVIPHIRSGWAVRRGGAKRASRVFDTRSQSIAYARKLCRKGGTLYVHGMDGMVTMREEYQAS